MKCKRETVTAVTTLFAALAMPVCLAAQDNRKPEDTANHRRYRLVDLGTFGGPSSTFQNPLARVLTNSGTAVGGADTAKPDPSHPCLNPFAASDCFIQHAFRWQTGVLTDLGALPGGNFSLPLWISEGGQIAGGSENGLTDPLTGAPEIRAVLWNDRNIIDLGTLGGTQSLAIAVNKHGQAIGATNNSVPDPFSASALVEAFPSTTQTRAFLWQQGRGMQDLGTLGGPDAFAQFVNDRGQVAGFSYTTGTPDPNTGIPPVHPFLWEDGKMVDIGTLGGAFGAVDDLNNRGQVVGPMDLAGDQTFHPYLWEHGKLSDLGTFGGSNGESFWINEAGEVVGWAEYNIPCDGCAEPGNQVYHAALWRHAAIADLGTVKGDKCSIAFSINSETQVVGTSGICHGGLHAFLWENGGPMIDLNTLIQPGSGLQLKLAVYINDSGEIAGIGVLPNGDTRAVLLIPCNQGPCETIQGNPPLPVMQSPATMNDANPGPVPPAARAPHHYSTGRREVWPNR